MSLRWRSVYFLSVHGERKGATFRRRSSACWEWLNTHLYGLDLEITPGAGVERVRVEHGHQLDPHNAFLDPTRPGDSDIGS